VKLSSVFLLSAAAALPCLAQVVPFTSGTAMGHLHLNAHDVDVQKQFWVKQMGATPVMLSNIEVMKFPGVLIFLKKADPSGGTQDSVVQHIGFKVRDLKSFTQKSRDAGFTVEDNVNGFQAYVYGPDKLKIELSEDKALTAPIINHHIHFYTKDVDATKAWYVQTFGAIGGRRAKFEAADLPGVNLTFSPAEAADKSLPTKGRVLDHIGFEVKNLEAFCKKLEAAGVKFDVGYRKIPAIGLSVAFFTDPFGTYIELTEGLDKI
jgi:catechol 2,3-dioxygenase-like lactoylglutathione lyase family enzyme